VLINRFGHPPPFLSPTLASQRYALVKTNDVPLKSSSGVRQNKYIATLKKSFPDGGFGTHVKGPKYDQMMYMTKHCVAHLSRRTRPKTNHRLMI
jgi:hypothetical protein